MFKFVRGFVGTKEELPWSSMQIVDHLIFYDGTSPQTWVLAHQNGKLYHGIKEGVISKDQIDRTEPSLWRDPETCLPPRKLDPANLYPKTLPRYTHFHPNQGVEESAVYRKQCIILKPSHRYLRDALNTNFIAQTTAREIDVCQILDMHPHASICKYYGVETNCVLHFKYRHTTIELLMDRERVLNLVFEKYECNLLEAIQRGYSVRVQDCLEPVAAGIKHMHSLELVHGDIKPENIFVKCSEDKHNLVPTRYVIGDFDSAQWGGQVISGKHGTPFWSRAKKAGVDAVEKDDDWFAFDQLKRWLVSATVSTRQGLQDYEGIGKEVREAGDRGTIVKETMTRQFALNGRNTY